MGKPLVPHTRSLKQADSKKKPIKVVYISTPMKFKTSVSKFRDLVQGLTGRDSNPADVERISAIDGIDDEPWRVPDHGAQPKDESSPVRQATTVDHEGDSSSASTSSPFDLFDGVFTPEMLENFIGLSPSSLLLEPQIDFFRSLDVV